ncbi:MAG: UDP-glucose 4-epimerase GalE [Bilophila sp.]
MKILITGGAGYIGSHTCKALAHGGHEVVTYDNLSTGHRDLVRWGAFEHGDILDVVRLREVMRRHHPDGVIHFAAKSQVGESVCLPGLYFRNNIVGTLNILEAMRDEGVENIVVSGTCAVYGQPETVPIREDAPKAPINPYGASKLFMEQMLRDFGTAHGLRSMVLRYFNAAGCDPEGETGERHDPETHLIPRALMALTGDAPELSLFGEDYATPDGTCIRDYIHVCDLAQAHVLAMQYLNTGGASGCLNLGTGNGLSVREILASIARVTGKVVPFRMAPRRAGDPPRLVADARRAGIVLHWRACQSDRDTIIDTAWNWYQRDRI